MECGITTTHFDYHSIDHNLLKLDILGHDDPTMIRTLEDYITSDAMENEYNAEVVMTPMGKKTVRWIQPEDLDERMSSSRNILAKDRFDQPVFLFENDFALRWFADKYPDVTLEENM